MLLVWPFIWGLTEQMTHNGYLVARFPLTFDAKFMAFRLLSPVPESIFVTWPYLQLRRLLPLAISHALMDAATVLIGALLPLLRA